MLYGHGEKLVTFEEVSKGTRSFLATLNDCSGMHFSYEKEGDRYVATVGEDDTQIHFSVFCSTEGIRVRVVGSDVITVNKFYDMPHSESFWVVPKLGGIHSFVLQAIQEVNERFPGVKALTDGLDLPYVTVRRYLESNGSKIVGSCYNLVYIRRDETAGVSTHRFSEDLSTKGTSYKSMLNRLIKQSVPFVEREYANFERHVSSKMAEKNAQAMMGYARELFGKYAVPKSVANDRITLELTIDCDRMEALKSFLKGE